MRAPFALVAVALFASVTLAGCFFEEPEEDGDATDVPPPPPTYRLGGSFTTTRDDEDLQEVLDLAEQYGGEGVIMESYPEQFQVTGLANEDCSALRTVLNRKTYLGSLGQCETE